MDDWECGYVAGMAVFAVFMLILGPFFFRACG